MLFSMQHYQPRPSVPSGLSLVNRLFGALFILALVGASFGCTPKTPPPALTMSSTIDVDPLVKERITEEARRAEKALSDPKERSRLAFTYDANEVFELAAKEYGILAQLAPRDPLWPYLQAICTIDARKPAEGRTAIEAVTTRFPSFAPAWDRLAKLRLDEGDLPGAKQATESALSANPAALPAKVMLADIALREGNAGEAVRLLEEVTRAATDDRHARFLLGRAYQRNGRDDAVVEVLLSEGAGALPRRLQDPRESTIATFRTGLSSEVDRGIALIQAGRAPEAVQVLERILRAHPEDSNVLLNLSQARNQAGDLPGALATIAQAAEVDPKNFRIQMVRAGLELGAGELLTNPRVPPGSPPGTVPPKPTPTDLVAAQKHFETALAAGSRAARFGPNEWRTHFAYARAAYRNEEYAIARDSLLKAQELAPDQPEISQFLFEIAWRASDQESALIALENAVRLNPQHLPNWVNLVHCRGGLGDLDGAAEALAKAKEIQANHPRVIDAAAKLDTLRAEARKP